jgi:hypothetical protein
MGQYWNRNKSQCGEVIPNKLYILKIFVNFLLLIAVRMKLFVWQRGLGQRRFGMSSSVYFHHSTAESFDSSR